MIECRTRFTAAQKKWLKRKAHEEKRSEASIIRIALDFYKMHDVATKE